MKKVVSKSRVQYDPRVKAQIIRELSKLRARISSSHGKIRCPNPKHNDSDPSCGVNLSTTNGIPLGFFHCLGCKFKGSWNTIAPTIGLPLISGLGKDYVPDNEDDIEFNMEFELSSIRNKLFAEDVVEKMIEDSYYVGSIISEWPVSETWRHLDGELLNSLGSKTFYEDSWKDTVIAIPATIYGNSYGIVMGRMHKSKNKKELSYLTSSGVWSKDWGLLGFDYARKLMEDTNYLVLTEGVRDGLRLCGYDIPAVSLLGTTWSDNKRDLVLSLMPKIVFIFFDSDTAGELLSKTVYNSLYGYVDVKVIKSTQIKKRLGVKKLDPANAPVKLLNSIKKQAIKFLA